MRIWQNFSWPRNTIKKELIQLFLPKKTFKGPNRSFWPFYQTKKWFWGTDTAFLYSLNITSIYISISLSRINEHGILQRVSEPFYARKPACTGSSVKFFAITIHDIQPAFIFLGSGYAISLILFIIEVIAAKYQRNRNLNRISTAPEISQELETNEIY